MYEADDFFYRDFSTGVVKFIHNDVYTDPFFRYYIYSDTLCIDSTEFTRRIVSSRLASDFISSHYRPQQMLYRMDVRSKQRNITFECSRLSNLRPYVTLINTKTAFRLIFCSDTVSRSQADLSRVEPPQAACRGLARSTRTLRDYFAMLLPYCVVIFQ